MADTYLGEKPTKDHKTLKRKRIRRLMDEPREGHKRICREAPKTRICNFQRSNWRIFFTCLSIALAVALLLGNYFSMPHCDDGDLVVNFVNTYRRHYNEIVHGKSSYCEDELETDTLFDRIKAEQMILHQSQALQEIQFALLLKKRKASIALVGPVGVGKNLCVNALQKYFPWPENVHSYVWNTFVHSESEKYRNLRTIINQFSDCGINLFVIRNLKSSDKELVTTINDILEAQSIVRKKLRVITFYIFNLNTMADEYDYKQQQRELQNLNQTKTIQFRAFGKKELADCIRLEMDLEDVALSHDVFAELVETIDVYRSGCKNVNAKVLAYGTKIAKTNDVNDRIRRKKLNFKIN